MKTKPKHDKHEISWLKSLIDLARDEYRKDRLMKRLLTNNLDYQYLSDMVRLADDHNLEIQIVRPDGFIINITHDTANKRGGV